MGMKAICYEGEMKIAVKQIEKPVPKDGEVLIKVAYAGVCGSDMTIYFGKHPRAKAGLVRGHEFSGFICSESKFPMGALVTVYPYLGCGKCSCCKRGEVHLCENINLIGIDSNGGMAEYVVVPEENIYLVPEDISNQLAAFIEPVGITVHAVRKGGYEKGKNVVVFGAGAIGLSCALTLRSFGAEKILVIDPVEERIKLAENLGFDIVPLEKNQLEAIMEYTNGEGADYVYDCAGHQSVVDILPDSVKVGGKIVIVAGYKVPPTMNFQKGMFREFSIQFVRNCSNSDFEKAVELINSNYGKLLNCILPIEDAQKGFDVPKGAYKVMFQIDK